MTPPWIKALDRIEVVEGELEIESGISAPSRAISLDSKGSWWYGNEQAIHIPSGIHVNLRDCYDSFRKGESIADMVLLRHHLKVLEKEIYK